MIGSYGLNMIQLVAFDLDDQHYALPLSTVARIVRVIEITPLPKAPEVVLGVFRLQGRIVPVFDVRRRFRLPRRDIRLSDHLIVGHTRNRAVALVADSVGGVLERSEKEVTAAQAILPGLEYIEGIAKLEGGLILIHDLNKFLSLEEESALGETLEKTELAVHEP